MFSFLNNTKLNSIKVASKSYIVAEMFLKEAESGVVLYTGMFNKHANDMEANNSQLRLMLERATLKRESCLARVEATRSALLNLL